ncbi:hypothetical protein J437_LFUL004997 [Ladona fulva]|uniref:Uncharacterized protein n=1 Tax=Ladona fulva TaxID=123851 RepID=A0A8K0P3N7_LADFU|nr:hypothetical protein J437_LFUL004997 [Ladona fulva]
MLIKLRGGANIRANAEDVEVKRVGGGGEGRREEEEDPPEIEVERSWVHSGEGFEAQLVCIVHGEPPPDEQEKSRASNADFFSRK